MAATDHGDGRIRLTGGQALARVLTAAGVRHVYGLAGGGLGALYQAIAESGAFRYVGTRHEAAGAFMAAGLFQATQELGVCLAEQGPGTHNLLAGLGGARANGLALLAITATVHSGDAYPFRGALMEMDSEAALRPLTSWNAPVRELARLPEVVRQAIREALTGRPGPVHLEIPRDVLAASADFDPADLDLPADRFLPQGRPRADPAAIEEAARLLRSAARPLLIAGGGASLSGAETPFRSLAARLGAAVTGTQQGIGVAATDGPGFVGHAGVIGGPAVLRAMREADVVLAAGCRFSSWLWEGGRPLVSGRDGQSVIQIDLDPAALGRNVPLAVGLQGDAAATLGLLDDAVARLGPAAADPGWTGSLTAELASHRAALRALADDDKPPLHPAALSAELARLLPEDALVVYDGGHTSFWTNDFLPARSPRTRFNEAGMAQLGFGLPYANALAARFPGRTVVNITGDGSFGFTLAELDTARRYGLRAVHVIHNNEAWGVIQQGQNAAGFALGAELTGTDYAALARAFGCHGERVDRADQIAPALQRALDSGLPAVLDVRVRFAPHPMLGAFGATARR